jgi:predicted metal-dependent peptidase
MRFMALVLQAGINSSLCLVTVNAFAVLLKPTLIDQWSLRKLDGLISHAVYLRISSG